MRLPKLVVHLRNGSTPFGLAVVTSSPEAMVKRLRSILLLLLPQFALIAAWLEPLRYSRERWPDLYDPQHRHYDPTLKSKLDLRTSLSVPLTVLKSLHGQFTTVGREGTLNIYVMAVVHYYEMRSNWTALWEARPPGVHTVNVLIGFAGRPSKQYAPCLYGLDSARPWMQPFPGTPGLHERCINGFFPDLMYKWHPEWDHLGEKVEDPVDSKDKKFPYPPPDLIFISGPGFPQTDRGTWDPALRYVLETDTPTIWSHYMTLSRSKVLTAELTSPLHTANPVRLDSEGLAPTCYAALSAIPRKSPKVLAKALEGLDEDAVQHQLNENTVTSHCLGLYTVYVCVCVSAGASDLSNNTK